LKLATSPDLKVVISNTTEAGYTLDPADTAADGVPRSFPSKLLKVLFARWEAKRPPVTVVPCELIEGNARILPAVVTKLAVEWTYPVPFVNWLEKDCAWLHTLVDRIVTGTPADHPLLATDPIVLVAEPFAFFALEDHPRSLLTFTHPAIVRAKQVE